MAKKILETLAKVQDGKSGSRSEKNFKKRRNRRKKIAELLSPMALGTSGAADGTEDIQIDLFGSSEEGETEQLPASPNSPTCFLASTNCSDELVECQICKAAEVTWSLLFCDHHMSRHDQLYHPDKGDDACPKPAGNAHRESGKNTRRDAERATGRGRAGRGEAGRSSNVKLRMQNVQPLYAARKWSETLLRPTESSWLASL